MLPIFYPQLFCGIRLKTGQLGTQISTQPKLLIKKSLVYAYKLFCLLAASSLAAVAPFLLSLYICRHHANQTRLSNNNTHNISGRPKPLKIAS
jgi:hypothetical protein